MNIFQSIEQFLQSEAGAAVLQTVQTQVLPSASQRVLAMARNTVDGIIADEIEHGDPARTEAQVVDDIDGRIWHNARPVLGWAGFSVDVLRRQPADDQPIRDLIAQHLAALAVKESSPASGGG